MSHFQREKRTIFGDSIQLFCQPAGMVDSASLSPWAASSRSSAVSIFDSVTANYYLAYLDRVIKKLLSRNVANTGTKSIAQGRGLVKIWEISSPPGNEIRLFAGARRNSAEFCLFQSPSPCPGIHSAGHPCIVTTWGVSIGTRGHASGKNPHGKPWEVSEAQLAAMREGATIL